MKKTTVFMLVLGLFLSAACTADAGMVPSTFKHVAKKVKPSVVNISTVKTMQYNRGPYTDPFFGDDFFEKFFGIPQGTFKRRNLGSGFIVHKSGYILTNNHVVDKADEITVKLYDGKEYKAKVVGTDRETDIAVIKIKAKGLIPIELGDSGQIDVGDWVVAIGSPFGLEQTVTQGIISAKARIIGAGPYDDFLQTDAAINPGNSGGPLVNLEGEVIGINTAISSTSGGYEGVGFAIPVNMAKKIYNDIVKTGKVERGWLGVGIQELTPGLAKHFKVEEGVLVSQVFGDSPAEKAGIERGDVIMEFNGRKLKEYRELQSAVAETQANKTVKVKVMRNGKVKELRVKIGERDTGRPLEPPRHAKGGDNEIGIIAGEITPETAKRYGIRARKGVVVLDILQGSEAEDAGVMRGDVIHEISGNVIRNIDDFNKVAQRAGKGSEVVLLIERSDTMIYLAYTIR